MNWKPKKGVGKKLYVVELDDNCNFSWYMEKDNLCTSSTVTPIMKMYKDVLIITNGETNSSLFITAKRKGDKEYGTFKLKKIKTIEENNGIIVMKGKNVFITNDKKTILKLISPIYKKRLMTAQQDAVDAAHGKTRYEYAHCSKDYALSVTNEQPKRISDSYKLFLQKLKKL
jgi:hypothetical protein